jgi:hypothetical protein
MIEDSYNKTYRTGLRMTPEEAWQEKGDTVKVMNKASGDYANTFKKRKRDIFGVGQQVRISNKENLKVKGKGYDRFQERGVIIEEAGKDSYLVKSEKGRIYKISHSDLKAIEIIR